LFVSGTDTGVGKTRVGCALLAAARERGLDVGVMKPIETGVDARGPLDALALLEAGGCADALDLVCPQRFALPAAPSVAAAAEGRRVDLAAIDRAFETLAARHDAMLVEGAGGLLVPIEPGLDMTHLASRLGLPVLVVARAALGTINHTRLSVEALEARAIPLVGVAISHVEGPNSEADDANLAALIDWLGERFVGALPHSAQPGADPGCLDVARILGR
jgi:dethiobiotin synthetase